MSYLSIVLEKLAKFFRGHVLERPVDLYIRRTTDRAFKAISRREAKLSRDRNAVNKRTLSACVEQLDGYRTQ